jgi:transcriptional regulator GlxA family with amidase domain
LRERMIAASLDQRFALLERVLLARRGQYEERRIVAAARTALEQPFAEVGRVARMVQLSRRRLIEVFRADVGMTPKRYARVFRFQRALAHVRSGRSWAQIALASGYYDQAHLCREWAELTGLTPRELTSAREIHVKDHHVALVKSIQYELAPAE